MGVAKGSAGGGGVSSWCFGWSGVTYPEPLPGPCTLREEEEEERETAVLLV